MRIIAGTLRGRRLSTPTWPGLRPTSDRLRETLFNVLGARVEGACFVDGYAGTGAVGLEAVSRGARVAVLVERDRRALALLRRNVAAMSAEAAVEIVPGAFESIRGLDAACDVVFLDPPYDEADLGPTLTKAAALVRDDGWVVVEHASRRPLADVPAGLELFRRIVSGDSTLAFLRRAAPQTVRPSS
jgi:16S rRNA (guanine(966)-N(2))-methyltransferase RsmD